MINADRYLLNALVIRNERFPSYRVYMLDININVVGIVGCRHLCILRQGLIASMYDATYTPSGFGSGSPRYPLLAPRELRLRDQNKDRGNRCRYQRQNDNGDYHLAQCGPLEFLYSAFRQTWPVRFNICCYPWLALFLNTNPAARPPSNR